MLHVGLLRNILDLAQKVPVPGDSLVLGPDQTGRLAALSEDWLWSYPIPTQQFAPSSVTLGKSLLFSRSLLICKMVMVKTSNIWLSQMLNSTCLSSLKPFAHNKCSIKFSYF